jgi:Undecaprenyl-phosphate galactose phosphotransferase WbaP
MLALGLGAGLPGILWHALQPAVDSAMFYDLWPLLGLFVLGYVAADHYPGIGQGPVEELRRLSTVTSALYVAIIVALFLSKGLAGHSRGIFLFAWGFSLLFVPLGRALVRHLLARRAWWGAPVLLLGAGKTGRFLIEHLRQTPGLGLKVLACVDDDTAKQGYVGDVPVLGPVAEAPKLAQAYRIRHALVAMPGVHPSELSLLVRRYAAVFPHLVIIPDMFGMTSLGLSAFDFGDVVGLHVKQNLLSPWNRLLKRSLDLLLFIPLALVALPLVAVAALWVVAASPGNPFYAQEREGYGGEPIRVWKLRTMFPDAEARLKQHLQEDVEARQEWERFYKFKHDPRILPRIGALLRRTSLDELPQLFNILKGEMSFVGPRPFPYYHLERFDEEFRGLRSSVRPGLTGLWQVSARSDGDLKLQRSLDSYYIRNWSLWLDLYLLARTPWAVLFGKGAY